MATLNLLCGHLNQVTQFVEPFAAQWVCLRQQISFQLPLQSADQVLQIWVVLVVVSVPPNVICSSIDTVSSVVDGDVDV
jgi:hypothetical protein